MHLSQGWAMPRMHKQSPSHCWAGLYTILPCSQDRQDSRIEDQVAVAINMVSSALLQHGTHTSAQGWQLWQKAESRPVSFQNHSLTLEKTSSIPKHAPDAVGRQAHNLSVYPFVGVNWSNSLPSQKTCASISFVLFQKWYPEVRQAQCQIESTIHFQLKLTNYVKVSLQSQFPIRKWPFLSAFSHFPTEI